MPSPSRSSALTLATVAFLATSASVLATCAPYDAEPMTLPTSSVAVIAEGVADLLEGAVDLNACAPGMVSVAGSYCPDVEHKCLRWLDPPGKYHEFRCAEYAREPVCRASRRPLHFCIDRDEQHLPDTAPDPRPTNNVSYAEAKNACSARGARLCTSSEWQFACEGEEMRPYPYGFTRDSSACNIDRSELGKPGQGLHDLRTPPNASCESPFGVRDLAGNLEEWVTRDAGSGGKATLLKGSWWMPGRSTCRATNAGHDAVYHGKETGFRCCR